MLEGFTNEQIVSLLDNHSLWSRRACREILRRKDEFVPLLLELLDKIINEKDLYECSVINRVAPASLLLAQMRVTEAYPRLVSLLSYGEDEVDFIWGDFLFEVIPSILRDTYDGNSKLLPALVENRSVSPWARMTAVNAYGECYQAGHVSREEIIVFFRRLANDVCTDKTSFDDKLILTEIGSCVRDYQIEEMIDDVKALYAQNAIDERVYGDLKTWLEDFQNPRKEKNDSPVNAIKELEKWRWFQELKNDTDDDDDDSYDDLIIGKNEPCPCGSGKKYKHCCGK